MRRALVSILLASCSPLGLIAQQGGVFVENKGQWPGSVSHRIELSGSTVWIERSGWTLDLYDEAAITRMHAAHHGGDPEHASPVVRHHAVRSRFVGGGSPQATGSGPVTGYHNYFLGDDPDQWAGGCLRFNEVRFDDLYPGIDLTMTKGPNGLKYDLLLAPGADISEVVMVHEGADGLSIAGEVLQVHTSLGTISQQIPEAWQTSADGERQLLPCHFQLAGDTLRFVLDGRDHALPAVIDPTLEFSTYSGSTSDNFGYTATFDSDGFLYSGSTAFGQGYPTTTGAYQQIHQGGQGLGSGTDIAITKYDTTGTFIVWSTFLGGTGDEIPHSLIVNSADEVFVYGTTTSQNFPYVTGCLDNTFNGGTAINLLGLGVNFVNGSDMIVSRLSAQGNVLLASTYLGGSGNDGLNTAPALRFNYADEVRGEVLLDRNENVYIVSTTASADFPTTSGSLQPGYGGGSHDGVVAKLDAGLTTLIWSTYFGGSGADAAYSVALNDAGDLYIAGGTNSPDLPTTPGVLGPGPFGGAADAFVAELAPGGNTVISASYWGTSEYDQAYFVELDGNDQVYLFGQTLAPGSVLIGNAPYNVPNSGQFLSKFGPDLTTVTWSSRFGNGNGQPNISPTAFLVDYCDKIYISGWGSAIQGGQLSTNGLPVTADAYQASTDGNDFYLAVFDIDMTNLFYATYFGGGLSAEHVDGGTSRFDRRGRVYQSVCAGCGGNSDFPIEPNPGAVSPTNNSPNCNNGVFKFDFNFPIVVAGFQTPPVNCLPSPIQFTNTSYGAAGYLWDFGDNSSSLLPNPSHQYAGPGVYTVTLIASDPNACNLADTVQQQVVVLGNSGYALDDVTLCAGESEQIGLLPIPDPNVTYTWSPSTGLTSTTVSNPIASPAVTTTYQLLISNGLCTDTVTQVVNVAASVLDAGPDLVACGPGPGSVTLAASSAGGTGLFQWSSSPAFSDTLNDPLTDSTAAVAVSGDATFYVRPLDNDCAGADSVFVDLQLVDPAVTGDTLVCADEPADLLLTGVEAGSSITWTPPNEIVSGQGTEQAVVAPAVTSSFGVDVTSPGGCTWSGSVVVNVSAVNGASVSASVNEPIVLPGTTVQLLATPAAGVGYTWSPSSLVSDATIADPTALITETTWFFLTVSDGICTRSDSVLVTVYELNCDEPDIFVPNAFTPNGDGSNDLLFVRGRFITELDFQVFDRWGEKVFETSDQNVGWDGTFRGKPVDPAMFVYHLTVRCEDGQRYFKKGNVTVIR